MSLMAKCHHLFMKMDKYIYVCIASDWYFTVFIVQSPDMLTLIITWLDYCTVLKMTCVLDGGE